MSEMTEVGKIDFQTFILSLGTATLVSIGEIENPVTKKKEKNLPSARHNIEILEMLSDKTRGNLDEHETKLLQSLLYELRMKFVEQSKASNT